MAFRIILLTKMICKTKKLYNEKVLRELQTLHTGCSKAEPKIFAPPQTPFPGVQDGQNLISWRWSLPLPTNPVWGGLMHAISSYHGNRPTNTNTQTHRQDRLQYTALLSLACSVITETKMNCQNHINTYITRIRKNKLWLIPSSVNADPHPGHINRQMTGPKP